MSTTCPKTVVRGKQGHASSKILSLHKASFLCQSYFLKIIVRLSHAEVKFGYPRFWGYYRI